MKYWTIAFILFFSLSFSGISQTLQVATYQYSTNNRLDNIKPLAAHLATVCNCTNSTKSYASVSDMLAGMNSGESDIVLMNTFGYLLLNPENKNYKPATALRVAPGKPSTYQGAIVVRKELGIQSLEGLKQKSSALTLRLVNPGSTSGNLVPRLGLAAIGVTDADKSFKEVSYSKNHALTLKEVAEGKYDVGAFGSEEYTKAVQQDSSILKKAELIWVSNDIPLGPVMIKSSLPKKLQRCITKELLNLHNSNKAALESVKAGWTEAIPADRYIGVSDKHYRSWLDTMGGDNALEIIRKFLN